MHYLRMLWELLTGRLHARIALLERDRDSFAQHYNQHVAWCQTKTRALSEHTNSTRAQMLNLASRVEQTQQTTVYRAFGDGDDEQTIALDEFDLVGEVTKGKRRR